MEDTESTDIDNDADADSNSDESSPSRLCKKISSYYMIWT